MQRCRAWLRLRLHDTPSEELPAPSHDCEPPPYHDLGTTSGPAAVIVSITSAISTVAIVVPSATVSLHTMDVAELISRMAHAIATTPHARDYHRCKPMDGHRVCVAGTAEALVTGIDRFLKFLLMQLARGDSYFSMSSYRSRDDALDSIHMETMYSPRASARIIDDHIHALSLLAASIVGFAQPVTCAPAVAAAVTSALANVAQTVAAAPEESMAAIAERYVSYAHRASHSIASGIIDAQSLQDETATAASISPSHTSEPRSSAANECVRRTRNALQGQTNQR